MRELDIGVSVWPCSPCGEKPRAQVRSAHEHPQLVYVSLRSTHVPPREAPTTATGRLIANPIRLCTRGGPPLVFYSVRASIALQLPECLKHEASLAPADHSQVASLHGESWGRHGVVVRGRERWTIGR